MGWRFVWNDLSLPKEPQSKRIFSVTCGGAAVAARRWGLVVFFWQGKLILGDTYAE